LGVKKTSKRERSKFKKVKEKGRKRMGCGE
jgi:hypothetical protein